MWQHTQTGIAHKLRRRAVRFQDRTHTIRHFGFVFHYHTLTLWQGLHTDTMIGEQRRYSLQNLENFRL